MSGEHMELLGKYVLVNETELCKINSLVLEPAVVLQSVKEGKCQHCQEAIGHTTQVVIIGSSQYSSLKPVPTLTTIEKKESDNEQH